MSPDEYAARRAEHLDDIRRALRRVGAGCVVSHESAAIVHGLPTYTVPEAVRLTRASGSRRTGVTRVHVAALPDGHVEEVDGIPVTSRARTAVDVARSAGLRSALVVADAAMRGGVRREELDDVLRDLWNWPRIIAAARVVRHADGRAESPGESVVRSRFIELDLPMPELQVVVGDEHGNWARSDFWWREFGVVGEADGRLKYTGDELWREKQRQEWLEEAGFVVIRWTWAQAHVPGPVFRARLLAAFARAAALRAATA